MSRAVGQMKEEVVCRFLQNQGYAIVDRNFVSRYGEIDVVANKGDTLFFIEVRYRNNQSRVGAAESVTKAKTRKLRLAIRDYIGKKAPAFSGRISVDLCVVKDGQGTSDEVLIIPGVIEF